MTTINQSQPSINGFAPSWSDIAINIGIEGGSALDIEDIAGIKYKTSLSVGKVKGVSGGRNMIQTTGESDEDASIDLYLSGIRKIKKALMQSAPTRGNQKAISLVPFTITVKFSVPGDDEIYTTILKGCRYGGTDIDAKPGTEAISSTVPLNPREIVDIINGEEVVLL
jgi:hypothetical protein